MRTTRRLALKYCASETAAPAAAIALAGEGEACTKNKDCADGAHCGYVRVRWCKVRHSPHRETKVSQRATCHAGLARVCVTRLPPTPPARACATRDAARPHPTWQAKRKRRAAKAKAKAEKAKAGKEL